MKVNTFEWNEDNEDHIISKHQVWPEEVEELFSYKHHVRKTKDKKYLVYGQTSSGRYLSVVVILKPKNKIKVITARDMTDKEKRAFRKALKE
jgi:uncharacterized protein